MLNALKKLDKKFLVFAVCIILLPIVLIVFLAIIQGCSGKAMTYEKYEDKMVTAAQKYLANSNNTLQNEGENIKIKLDDLVKKGYIKSASKALKDDTCDGYVTVRRNGASIESNKGGYLNYISSLKCSEYSTNTLADKLKLDVTESGAGLYLVGDTYIFKGENPKNRLTFYGNEYRIMSMDSYGIIKLVKVEPELTRRLWDNKYNVDINHNYGINKYSDSSLLKVIISDYENSKKISKKAKEHVVAYDTCIGKRNSNDYSISKDLDCSEVLTNQVVSLMSISDYALGSTDTNCTSIISKACNNYNYLYNVASSTWTSTAVLDNSYQVLFISNGVVEVMDANIYNEYNLVIYIDGNEHYQEGSGSEIDPYVIK